jgi:hypothetical protein
VKAGISRLESALDLMGFTKKLFIATGTVREADCAALVTAFLSRETKDWIRDAGAGWHPRHRVVDPLPLRAAPGTLSVRIAPVLGHYGDTTRVLRLACNGYLSCRWSVLACHHFPLC